jgi:spoIIIJ-associated protein
VKSVIKTGRTVDEAVASALSELGVSGDQAEVEVLAEPSRGFLGLLGGKDAEVKVTIKADKLQLARDFVSGVLSRMGMEASLEVLKRDESVTFNIVGENLGILIGRRGDTLKAFEFLTNVASGKGSGEFGRVFVDAAGYRQRRERELADMALSVAKRVERLGSRVAMEPMDARDRRVVHVALQGRGTVETYSEGEEPFRRVIVAPLKDKGKMTEDVDR